MPGDDRPMRHEPGDPGEPWEPIPEPVVQTPGPEEFVELLGELGADDLIRRWGDT